MVRVDGMERLVEDRGRPATSLLLRELGRHITSVLRPLDLVGQLDDEHLAAVCAGVHDDTTVARIAERILEVAAPPARRRRRPGRSRASARPAPASGQRRPAALLQAALEAADAVSDRGGDAVQLV